MLYNYILSQSYYEECTKFFFTHEIKFNQEEFELICNNLLDRAVELAIQIESEQDYPSYVGWYEIIKAMIPLLEEKGFKYIEPVECEYFGSGIINNDRDAKWLKSSAQKVIDYNSKVSFILNLE